MPVVDSLDALNALIRGWDVRDEARRINGRRTKVEDDYATERPLLQGKAVHTTVGPKLTAKERNLQLQCNLRLAGTAFAVAGGIMGKNWLAVLGAAFNGGAALAGPCKQLWDSTKRFRK